MVKRIAISGSHGVGKSTLINEIVNLHRAKVCLVGNIMRDLAKQGFPVGSAVTPQTIAKYLEKQKNQEIAASKLSQNILSDRILLDGLAYIQASAETGICSYSWSPNEILLLESAARLHSSFYDYQVILPIEFPVVANDFLNLHGDDFRKIVDDKIHKICANDWPIPVHIIKGSVKERVNLLEQLIDL
jgi:dephospho-CoA kinase